MIYRYADINDFSTEQLNSYFKMMSAERQQKALKLRAFGDYERCVIADYLIRSTLAELDGIRPEELIFSRDENGKPFAENSSYYFSISHSRDFAMCAVDDKPVGCDIEEERGHSPLLWRRIVCGNEGSLIEEGRITLTELWTLKEAFLKRNGAGIKAGLQSVEFSFDGDKIVASDSSCDMHLIKEIKGYPISICTSK